MARTPVVAVTSGEPAGIGPEICAALTQGGFAARVVLLGDEGLLRTRGVANAEILHLPLVRPAVAGQLDAANAPYVLALLDRAVDGAMAGEFDAVVTAPVQKSIINDAGIGFSGHTEYLAARAGGIPIVMMLAGGGMRVALATTHLALADVPRAITRESLFATLRVLDRDLRERFRLSAPRILAAGLNPHAGEGGYLGREEIEVIVPVLAEARAAGIDVEGPLPADTLFVPERLAACDCVLAMYHDQGLPVLKHASFGRGVNVTLGLPFVRTSVDHGTALDLAGRGKADAGSFVEALRLAIELAGGK